jgi:hypothetical protein
MEFWEYVRRTMKILSTIPRYRLLASFAVGFFVLAVLANASGSNEPYATTMTKKRGKGDANKNLRFIKRDLDTHYDQGQGK